MILNLIEQLIILNKVSKQKSKILINVLFGENKDNLDEATVRKELAEAKDNAAIVYLQICTGFEMKECIKMLSHFSKKDFIYNLTACFKNEGTTYLERVSMELHYPNHECWSYCLPIKGGAEYLQEDGTTDIYDLGLCWTGRGWSAAIVYGEDDSKYMSGGSEGSFWFSQKCYKDLLNFSIDIGIHSEDYLSVVAESYNILREFMRSDKDYWDLTTFLKTEKKAPTLSKGNLEEK